VTRLYPRDGHAGSGLQLLRRACRPCQPWGL